MKKRSWLTDAKSFVLSGLMVLLILMSRKNNCLHPIFTLGRHGHVVGGEGGGVFSRLNVFCTKEDNPQVPHFFVCEMELGLLPHLAAAQGPVPGHYFIRPDYSAPGNDSGILLYGSVPAFRPRLWKAFFLPSLHRR
ncbi:hypothetical protein NPIL_660191 [Nephila pilipes]|uniref:Uncharacterized protein n=1 Tax=Nephila pilipes TaxID=299642 RepID=A0A8X6MDU8_NEPPI|nr:hypothetical protein NPIL_660191 [Nephila pilipes]